MFLSHAGAICLALAMEVRARMGAFGWAILVLSCAFVVLCSMNFKLI